MICAETHTALATKDTYYLSPEFWWNLSTYCLRGDLLASSPFQSSELVCYDLRLSQGVTCYALDTHKYKQPYQQYVPGD